MFYKKIATLLVALAGLGVTLPARADALSFVPTSPSAGTTNKQIICLGDALQYEAEHTVAGNASVATAIFARVRSGEFRSICHAVYAYRTRGKHGYSKAYSYGRNPGKGAAPQFSYTTMGKPWPWNNGAAHRSLWFNTTLPIAKRLYADFVHGTHTVAPAIQRQVAACDSFHTTGAKTSRKSRKNSCGVIAGHLFYASNGLKKTNPGIDDIITAAVPHQPPKRLQGTPRELASN
jgi:hypothetical protein